MVSSGVVVAAVVSGGNGSGVIVLWDDGQGYGVARGDGSDGGGGVALGRW